MNTLVLLGLGTLLLILGLSLLGLDMRMVATLSLVSLQMLYLALGSLVSLSRKNWEIGKKVNSTQVSSSKAESIDYKTRTGKLLTVIEGRRSAQVSKISLHN